MAWWDGGVQFGLPDVAGQLADAGVEPHHLKIPIRGETVCDRLHKGISSRRVIDMLRREHPSW